MDIKRGGGDGAGYHTSRSLPKGGDGGVDGAAHGGRSLRSVRPGTALGALRLAEVLRDLQCAQARGLVDCLGSWRC